jgi:competence ComEA-like helix-hairpin-helix protein
MQILISRILWLILLASLLTSCTPQDAVPVSNSSLRTTQAKKDFKAGQQCVNLNTATAEELASLPAIGEVMAKRVISHRERHGPFRRPEEVIIIEGFSEKKYLAIADSICVD